MGRVFGTVTATACAMLCITCFLFQLPTSIQQNSVAITTAAAGLTMPDGAKAAFRDGFSEEKENVRPKEAQPQEQPAPALTEQQQNTNTKATIIRTHRDMPGVQEVGLPHSVPAEGEDTHPINERQIGFEGTDVWENIAVKNMADVGINIAEELQKQPDITITKETELPQVILYHTHTTESYMMSEQGSYPHNFYPRTTREDHNVVAVGERIARELQQAGISVVHDTTIHDNPSYIGSYYRSEDTVSQLLAQYPSVGVTIDIHRDAIGNDQVGHTKPTCDINGEKVAQVMIIAGCDTDGSVGLPDWEYNLRFALRLQQTANTMYPGFTRPLQFCKRQYNMHLTRGSLLVEMGGDVNTLDEAQRSGSYLGKALVEVLNGLQL